MIRSDHRLYDLREVLGSPRVLFGVLAIGGFFILFISLQFVYPVILIFVAMVATRGLIGRRCPRCDGPLKEVDAERDKESAFVLYIIWRCPRDGHQEKEKTKADSGLFGVR
jgi:hypothetical protein